MSTQEQKDRRANKRAEDKQEKRERERAEREAERAAKRDSREVRTAPTKSDGEIKRMLVYSVRHPDNTCLFSGDMIDFSITLFDAPVEVEKKFDADVRKCPKCKVLYEKNFIGGSTR